MRRQWPVSLFVLLLAALLAASMGACAPATPDAQSSAVAASAVAAVARTATAAAMPSATPVPPTATATATQTPAPTSTPNRQATADQQTTRTAQAAETATQAALTAKRVGDQVLLSRFYEEKSFSLRPDTPITLADFSESLALNGSYRWWLIDEVEPLADFVIFSHIRWEYPDEFPQLNAGSCGFVMRLVDGDQNMVAVLSSTNTLSLSQKTADGYVRAGIRAPWGPFNDQIRTRENAGEADIAIVAQRERVSLYIDGYKDSEWVIAHYAAGKIGYMILSDSNVGYGIQCDFTDTRVFPLR